MPLTCNINAKGKAVRLVYGLVLVVAGAVLMYAWAVRSSSTWGWIVSACCVVGGAFAIFEARAGWCAIRAMGFRTPV